VELGVQNVHFAGGHPSHELSRYYAVADCHVLPSLSEPWGLVINEAMACGLPVVATEPVGAGPDLLHEGGNGYVVPARDPPALADAILKVLATPETAAAMGEVSREIIKHFGIEQQAQGFIEAIQMVLER
jgi:glycosyltransferase involved in cell wall biosynthesis